MHTRSRHLINIFKKRSGIFPVLGLLGPRQVGKSTFLREQWAPCTQAGYITLDQKGPREKAAKAPEHFLKAITGNAKTKIIIDEAQKAPDLFDAVKVVVDEKRTRGLFTLSGSSEFSSKSYIRESLTGRIGISRLYPLTIREIRGDKFSNSIFNCMQSKFKNCIRDGAAEIETWLERGGMPVFCRLRDKPERFQAIEEWIETLCFRDLHRLKGARYDSELAKDILFSLAKFKMPTALEVAYDLKVDSRKIKTHLEGLKALFAIHEIKPHRAGIGKSIYLIFDSGVAAYLGAKRDLLIKIWFVNECLAQFEYSDNIRPSVTYYTSSKHSLVDYVINDRSYEYGILLSDDEAPDIYIKRTAEAFLKKVPKSKILIFSPGGILMNENSRITILPWNYII